MDVRNWQELFESFKRRTDDKRRQEAEARELTTWYDAQTKLVMGLVRDVALERARAFEEGSGQRIEVESPSRPPINSDPEGPFMSFMAISLGQREVHLYSHRLAGGAPMIHYVVTGDKGVAQARKRVIGRPGCCIEKREGGGFILRDASDPKATRREISADDVAFRAFQLLLALE